MAQPGSALPFLLRRKTDVVGMMEITSTTEVSHGLLRSEEDTLRAAERRERVTSGDQR